jgi:hypothetical protein
MADLLLDATGDLAIANGDLQLATGAAAVAQDWNLRVAEFKGEWPLDTRVGIDYQNLIFGPRPPDAVLRGIYERVTRETAGVKDIQRLEFSFDRATRALRVDAIVTADTGESVVLKYSNILFVDPATQVPA